MRCVYSRCPTGHRRVQKSQIGGSYAPTNKALRSTARTTKNVCHGILDSYRQSQKATASAATVPEFDDALMFESADEDTCPAECVEEVSTPADFKAKCEDAGDAVVVLDLYKTSCGACKYLMPGFLNMCKVAYGEGDIQPSILFLKHNVYDDEEDEKTDLARRLGVAGVPKFMIFRNMELIDEFSTRDKQQLTEAVRKHTSVDL